MRYFGNWFGMRQLVAIAGLATVVAVASPAAAQVTSPPSVPAPRNAAEAAQEIREEAREAARATRQEAREVQRDVREETRPGAAAREIREEGREAAQELRREGRETARELTGRDSDQRDWRNLDPNRVRAADFGLWFNGQARTAGSAGGLVIADVSSDGAIAKAGFREGDRIVSVNGRAIDNERTFVRAVLDPNFIEKRSNVVVLRDGREQTLYFEPSVILPEMTAYDPLWQFGVVVDDRDPNRVVIQRVYPRTPAYYSGLRSGDVVVSVGGQRVGAIANFIRAFTNNRGQNLALQVNRGNQLREVQVDTGDVEVDVDGRANLDTRDGARTRAEGGVRVEAGDDTKVDVDLDSRTNQPRNTPQRPVTPGTPVPEVPETPEIPPVPPRAAAPRPATPATPRPTTPAIPATPSVPSLPQIP
jgi:C-terminal processing protease CtpA/Prc